MLLTHLVLWNRIAVHELSLLVALSNLSIIQEYRDTSVILLLFFFLSNLENCFEFPVYDFGNVVPLFSHQNNRRMKATLMNICISIPMVASIHCFYHLVCDIQVKYGVGSI